MAIAKHNIPIEIDEDAIKHLCQRYCVCKLSLFGSVLRDDFHDDSDVDVLVEFEPGRTPGFEFIDIQDQLSEIIGRRIDLNTPKSLSHYFRAQIIDSAKVIYVQP